MSQRIDSSRTDGDFCHRGRDTKIAPKICDLSNPTDMTIHWKALEHFLMVPLVFLFIHGIAFSEFFLKTSVLKELISVTIIWLVAFQYLSV
jgi:hypothetical protein